LQERDCFRLQVLLSPPPGISLSRSVRDNSNRSAPPSGP
jgi:hypothetical protein